MKLERFPFIVAAGDLSPGEHRDRTVRGHVEVELDGGRVDDDVEVIVRLTALADGVLAKGTGSFRATLICHRCLTEWEAQRSFEVLQVYQAAPDEDGRQLEADGSVDLEPVIHDEVVLDIPMAPLCRSDCRGLCAVCGTDLNSAPCSGHTDESDHPFAALRQLLDPQDT